ncbi:Os03g0581650 [Oryza sativa Japonica Group]|uniref:Os03g0581650 protein n=1 Tax=Oryza sativa subsp. japonica TaxID=39947 RepID=A0A0P0VZN2_ORYSJ|nr:hypothetical protein EE612_018623 [Oryza sativa]BAS85060.1 Os03g0581650 [Oryza sativa Japonica Group]
MERGDGAIPFRATNIAAAAGTPTSASTAQGDRENAVSAEIERVNKLPANSSYAIHRLKVLNKLRHLLSIKRTTSQDEELELLFASLSI